MEKIKLEIVGLSSSQSQTGSFAIILGELGGNRRLPIIIGMFEAQAIAIEIEKIVPNRPMTHDLFKSFAEAFNFQIKEIMISDLKEGVFYAKIVCGDDFTNVEIDSRPSDAIAIALRFGVDIFTNENIMSEAGIVISDVNEDESGKELEIEKEFASPKQSKSKADEMRDFSVEQLKKMLSDALNNEDYEKAARIRDELNKRS
ncbi:MAG: bifunctional nuclease family protein [Cytophagales bacterium]